MSRERSFNLLRTVVSMGAALLVAFVIILLVSDKPVKSVQIFLLQPFSSERYLGNIVETAIPLIFSGLSMALLFQAGLFNLGSEGVFFLSGIAGSLAAIWLKLPVYLFPFVCIFAGILAGMFTMLAPGFLKAKYGASEMVTSLMMNSIVYGIGCYILNNVMRDPSVSSLGSYKYRKAALLPVIVKGTRIHLGLVLALLCVFLIYVLLYRTKVGYEIRAVGTNFRFARYSGIGAARVILSVHLIDGAVAGCGGIVECLGMHKRFEWTALPGYGFDGAMIAMLAGNNPFGVAGAALFVAWLRVGADLVNRFADVPTEMIALLQSLIILLISAEKFLHKYKQAWMEKDVAIGGKE